MAEKKINKLCEKCLRKCKQGIEIQLLTCPNFEKKPKQLEFNFKKSVKK